MIETRNGSTDREDTEALLDDASLALRDKFFPGWKNLEPTQDPEARPVVEVRVGSSAVKKTVMAVAPPNVEVKISYND